MRTLTGLLLDPASDPTDEQRRTMLETMERNAERMQHLVEEILDLARYRSGTIGLQLRQFDASEVAESAAATIRPLAEQRGQTVDLQIPAGRGPRVFGDRPRLDRALLNLVANAQRFAPDEGRVTIRLHIGARRQHPLGGDRRRAWHLDRGPGAPFRAVLRRAARPGAGQEGVGLGLPGALAIAQAHGGTIEVHSRLGQGSTFSLVVPSAGPAEDA